MAEPPLSAGTVQLRLICEEATAVAASPVGVDGGDPVGVGGGVRQPGVGVGGRCATCVRHQDTPGGTSVGCPFNLVPGDGGASVIGRGGPAQTDLRGSHSSRCKSCRR